jgi:hypothetical protein
MAREKPRVKASHLLKFWDMLLKPSQDFVDLPLSSLKDLWNTLYKAFDGACRLFV